MQLGKTVVIVTFAVLLCFSANGFSENQFLKALPDVVDFGTVDEGELATATITIQNTGNAIEITNVRTN